MCESAGDREKELRRGSLPARGTEHTRSVRAVGRGRPSPKGSGREVHGAEDEAACTYTGCVWAIFEAGQLRLTAVLPVMPQLVKETSPPPM